ncbi:lipopolysaccharide biosynthesis protein [Kiritimatiellota bacterium B12222]|nr:lipopolysaccharide biosynthesis protein [Kiritimatiellota bacterium B12222]
MTTHYDRNLFWLLVQRIALISIGLVYVLWIPRLLGPELFGSFTLLFSVLMGAMIFTELGAQSTLSRCLPRHPSMTAVLFKAYAYRQWALSILFALGAFGIGVRMQGGDLLTGLLFASTVLLGCGGQIFYAVPLAKGHGARWGMSFVVRRLLGLGAVALGFRCGGWKGILVGLLLVELTVCLIGAFWSREDWRRPRRSISPKRFGYLFRFGLEYQLAGIFLLLWRYAGEWSVKGLTDNAEFVGYYALAMGIYVAAEAALQQLGAFSAPYLRRAGSGDEMLPMLTRRTCWLFVPGFLGVLLSFWLREPFVRVLAGEDYLPAAQLLPWMAAALCVYLPVPLFQARMLAEGRSRLHRLTSFARLGLFMAAVIPAVSFLKWQGVAAAMLLSNLGYTGMLCWRLKKGPTSKV